MPGVGAWHCRAPTDRASVTSIVEIGIVLHQESIAS